MIKIHVYGRLPGGVKKSQILNSAGMTVAAKNKESVINIIFVSPAKIRELNRLWRKLDRPTDVLSFQAAKIPKSKKKEILGEVFVSPVFIKESLKPGQKNYQAEVLRAVIHGVLHILGYNHTKPADGERMMRIQESVLKKSLPRI